MRLLRWFGQQDRKTSQQRELEWRDAILPPVVLREPKSDGLTFQLKEMTIWSSDYSGAHFAAGEAVFVIDGVEKRRENVLMMTHDPADFAEFLRRRLVHPKGDATILLFDDNMSLRIENHGMDVWRVYCRPVPMPPPGHTWDTYPVLEFVVTTSTIETAITDLDALSSLLTPPQQHPLP